MQSLLEGRDTSCYRILRGREAKQIDKGTGFSPCLPIEEQIGGVADHNVSQGESMAWNELNARGSRVSTRKEGRRQKAEP